MMKPVLALLAVLSTSGIAGCRSQDPLAAQGVRTYVKVPNRVVSQDPDGDLSVEIGFVNQSTRPVEIHPEDKGISMTASHLFQPSHTEEQSSFRFYRSRYPVQVPPGDTLRARVIRGFRARVRPGPYRLVIRGAVRVDGVSHPVNPPSKWLFFRNTQPWPEGATFDIPAR